MTFREQLQKWEKDVNEFINMAQYELSTEGRKERRRRKMKKYGDLKEVQERKKHAKRKLSPKYCSLKIRVTEEQYKTLQENSILKDISMAEYARRRIFQ